MIARQREFSLPTQISHSSMISPYTRFLQTMDASAGGIATNKTRGKADSVNNPATDFIVSRAKVTNEQFFENY